MSNAEMQKKIEELQAQVQELLLWKQERGVQQLAYPLDEISRVIITNTNG